MTDQSNKELFTKLWEEYRPYYLQAQDGIVTANIHIFEHAVKEITLLDSMTPDDEFDEDTILAGRDNAVSVIEELINEGKVQVNNISSQVKCSRCTRFQKGVIRTVNLPNGETYEYERLCYVCGGG